MSDVSQGDLQYIYCAPCLEMQDIKPPEVAITIVNGHAVCEEHRRRTTNLNIGSVIGASRKHMQEPRNSRPSGYRG
jgi:hypothetical protein